MSYFNHAFKKTMLGSKEFTEKSKGVLGTANNIMAKGEFGFVGSDWKLVDIGSAPTTCCPLTLVSGSLYAKDNIGPHHGGYKESNKSKLINPKFVHKFYRVDDCAAQNHVIALGYTPDTIGLLVSQALTIVANGTGSMTDDTYTNIPVVGKDAAGNAISSSALATVVVSGNVVTSVTITSAGQGYGLPATTLTWEITSAAMVAAGSVAPDDVITGTYTPAMTQAVADCCQEFLCDETYSLRVDVKGEAALELLAHNAYLTVEHYTGCCADPSNPTVVDSSLVYIEWAKQLSTSPIMKDFLEIVVTDETNKLWYADDVDTSGITPPTGFTIGGNWKDYVSPGHTLGECAGMSIQACYVSTEFGDCSFQYIDGYNYQPLKIYASEVDYTGSPCNFTGICVVDVCPPVSPMGLGESVVRDLILSESYGQNHFATDIRIREITQGNEILEDHAQASIRGKDNWVRYQILHTVPRYNNPTGVFDNDQYLLEIITAGNDTNFENFMASWLGGCADCPVSLEVISCDTDACTEQTPFVCA